MKNNLVATLLVGLVGLEVLVAGVLCVRYLNVTALSPKLQERIDEVNRSQALVKSLANDILEYSKRNPAIDPLLQQFGLKARPAIPGTPTVTPPAAPTPSAPKSKK
jgi:hypothetical protein